MDNGDRDDGTVIPPRKESWTVIVSCMEATLLDRQRRGLTTITKQIEKRMVHMLGWSQEWTTCACGEQELILLNANAIGEVRSPWDYTLSDLGYSFPGIMQKFRDSKNLHEALFALVDVKAVLKQIDMRSTWLLSEIEKGRMQPPTTNAVAVLKELGKL